MASKSEILNNLREFTSDQIVEAINAGTVTLYELSKSGNLTPLMRRRIEEKLSANPSESIPSQENIPIIDKPTSSFTESSNPLDEEVEIPRAIEIDVPSEVSIPTAPIITATSSPSFDAGIKEEPKVNSYSKDTNKGMFKRPFSFNGRIRRMELWISILLFYLYAFAVGLVFGFLRIDNTPEVIIYLCLIPGYWFIWAQSAKRCHDRGNSGWYQLIPFYFLVLLFGGSEEGDNNYGDNPKE